MPHKSVDITVSLLGGAAFLAVALTAAWRGRNPETRPVAWPFALLCLNLFAYSLTQAISDSSEQPSWHWLNAVAASLTAPLFYHLVLAFVGFRRRFARALIAAYAYFGVFAFVCLLPFAGVAPGFPGGDAWAAVMLAGELPVLGHATLLLLRNLKLGSIAERSRTRLILSAALIAGTATALELLGLAGWTWAPNLAMWGLLSGALLLGAAALRVLHGVSWLSFLNALAIGASVALAELLIFHFVGHLTALWAAGTVVVALGAMAAARLVVIDYAQARERTLAHASLGRLAAQLAHDLKNPLAAIRGTAQFLQGEREAGRSIDSQGEFLTLLIEQCDRLGQLIEHYQRIGRAQPQLAPAELSQIAEQALSFLRTNGVPVEVKLSTQPLAVNVDSGLIAVALENLLRNAHEAAPGKSVEVSTGALRAGDANWAYVLIKDTGPGMSPRAVEQALEGFFTTKAQGSGLGLAFVRRVVEAHQGRLRVDSVEGRGTAVQLDLPMRA